ncbi:M14 family zinc carboxypeptidase [Candidatus Propionivibrio aalborgensis]|nr:M14 family zinc carboxypeptidase [Candidatus Propionivibrio aalborgensis]
MINDWIPGQPLQFHWYGAADNVKGKIPQFKVKFWTSTTHNSSTDIILYATNYPFDIAGGYRPEWSYDARTWNTFDNCLYDADNLHLRFYNNAAFTQDTVYYSTSTPWQESLTGEWLATLPTTYIQETPSVIAYGGADYVFGQSVPRVNELSEAIDACNLYAFKISSGSGLAPNGLPKKKFLLSAGNHAGEDPGNWALKGCVEFLISADARAVIARQWLDFYVYPMLIPAGRRGGHWRSDWEPGYLTYDANRHWTDSTMSTIVAFKNAIIADTGGAVAGSMSFHSSFPAVTQTYMMPNSETSNWASAINTHFGSLQPPEFYDQPTAMNGWTVSALGAIAATVPEVIAKPAAALEIFGANYGKVISDLAVINYFSAGASSGFETVISATTANAVGSITSKATAKTVIAATTADSVGSIASKATSKTVVAATTANAVGAIASKATAKTVIAATTANAVGNIASANAGVCASAITATTAGATASIISKSTCKTAVTTTTANAVGAIASKATSKTAIAATTANAVGAIASSSVASSTTTISATTANTVGAINGYSTCKTAISATLAGVFGTINSASQIPATTEIHATTGNAIGAIASGVGSRFDTSPDAIVTVINKRNRVSVISRRS